MHISRSYFTQTSINITKRVVQGGSIKKKKKCDSSLESFLDLNKVFVLKSAYES